MNKSEIMSMSMRQLIDIVDDMYKMIKAGKVELTSYGSGINVILTFNEQNITHQSYYDSYTYPLKQRIDLLKNMVVSPPIPTRVDKINNLTEGFLEERVIELQNEVEQLKSLIKAHLPQIEIHQ
jgi:hypothetical protein